MTDQGYEERCAQLCKRLWTGVEESLHREIHVWSKSGERNSNFHRPTGGEQAGTISPGGQRTSDGPMVWASVHIWGTASWWFMAEMLMILRSSRNFPSKSSAGTMIMEHNPSSHWILSQYPQTDAETKTWENLVYEAQRRKGGKSTLSYQWAYGCGHLGPIPLNLLGVKGTYSRTTTSEDIYSRAPSSLGWGLLWGR